MAGMGMGLSEAFIVMVMLFGGGGVPLGTPPLPPDPFMDSIAPEQCILYSSWNGLAIPSGESDNETEKLFAEPEIQEFVKRIEVLVRVQMAKEAGANEERELITQTIPDIVRLLLTQPTTIYISNVGMKPEGPTVSGAIVVKGGDRLAATVSRLKRLLMLARGAEAEDMEIRGTKFQRITMESPAPTMYVGTYKGYLIIGTGDGSIHRLMSRVGKDAPEWLVNARKEMPVERRATTTFIDTKRLRALGKQFGGPQVAQILQAFAIDDVDSVISTSGLEGKGNVSTIRVKMAPEGRLKKLLSSLKTLDKSDFADIPADAAIANVGHVDIAKVLQFARESAAIVDPNSAQMLDQYLEQIEQQLGFNPQRDLAEALGSRWTMYTAPDTGLYTGVLLTVEVDDFEKLNKVITRLLGMAQAMPDFAIASRIINGATVYSMLIDDDFPVSPSFCLTEKEFIIAFYPQAIIGHITRPAGKTLTEVEEVAEALGADNPPSSLVYVDTRRIFELAYPFIQGGYAMMSNSMHREGIGLEPATLPSAGSVLRHLKNSVMTVTVVDDGLLIERRQQFPGGSLGATSALALGVTLPAVGAARGAAQRAASMNNLKQIGLAYHNYHDTFNGMPCDSYDKDGKPLLSWRVHILPFIEQQALYQQFKLDEPWDSEHNIKLVKQMPQFYIAPGSQPVEGKTVYQAPVGKDTIMPPFDNDIVRDVAQVKAPIGIRFFDILDGTSNTIMAVEVSEDLAVTWTKPADYKVDKENPTKGLVGLRRGGFQIAMCDGSVRFVSEFIDMKVLNSLFTRNGGEIIPNF